MMKRKLVPLTKAAVTIALLLLLFRRVDFQQFWETLSRARIGLLVLSLALLWFGHFICIFRWRILMRPLMPILSIARLFGIACIGLFFNLAFPTVIGGDVVKMYYAGRASRQFAHSFAATFLDRDTGMMAMMMIACAATLIYSPNVPGIPVTLIVWSVLAAFVFGNALIFAPALHRRFSQALVLFRLRGVAAKVDKVSHAFQIMSRHWTTLVVALLISLVNQLLVIAVTWVMSEGLRLHVSFAYFLVLVPVVTLISMIPISLSGMGLREYAYLSLLGGIGVAPESSLALGLLSSGAVLLSAIPGGVIYVLFREQSDAQEMAAVQADLS